MVIRDRLDVLLAEARTRTLRPGPGLSATAHRSGVQQFRLGRVHQVTVQIRRPLAGTNFVTEDQIDEVATAAESLLGWLTDRIPVPNLLNLDPPPPPQFPLRLWPLLVHWPTGVGVEYSTDEGATATITIPLTTPEEYGKL